MHEWWNDFSALEQVFFLMAVPSTLILLIQTILLFFSGAPGSGTDSDTSGLSDLSETIGGDLDTDSEAYDLDKTGLRIFSIRGVMAFLSVGGWCGLMALGAGLPEAVSVLISFIFGLAALYGIAKLIAALLSLQESGNVDMRKGIGLTAKVYLSIPPEGMGYGKINLVLGGSFGEYTAISYEKKPIKTGMIVRIVDIHGENFVVESEK